MVCDGALMIDLSPMKSVRVDPIAKTARVEAGVLLGQFDRVPRRRTGPVGKGARQANNHFDGLQLIGQLRQPAHVLI